MRRRGLQNFFASREPAPITINIPSGNLKSSMQGAEITIPEHTQKVTRLDEQGNAVTRPAKSSITIRQLLSHSSGIGYSFSHPKLAGYYKGSNIRGTDYPSGFIDLGGALSRCELLAIGLLGDLPATR